jgi:hypothetical protein
MSELRECPNPKCRSANVESYRYMLVAKTNRQYVRCLDCGMHGPIENGKSDAEAAWNAMPREPAPLVWSSDVPKAVGDYKVRGLYRVHGDTSKNGKWSTELEFAGPIPEPVEAKP